LAQETAGKIEAKTIVECENPKLVQGELDSSLWVVVLPENKLKVAMDVDEYMTLLSSLKECMKENFELKLEKAILSEFPIDYDDVKAVVLEEMKKDQNKSIKEIVEKIKLEHPNLFYKFDFDKI
jgi:hypothetical protein